MKPFVSIVLPAYNAAQHLESTLDSVLSQTYKDFELVIVDDGSSDETYTLAESFCKRDSRIKLIHQENQGAAAARNKGIQNAQGIYIAFLDADDLWVADKLAIQVEHLEQDPKLGMSFGKVQYITAEDVAAATISSVKLTNITAKDFFEENLAVTPSNTVFRKEALLQVGGFNEDSNLLGFEDVELFIHTICEGWKIEGINKNLISYRLSEAGVSSDLSRMEKRWYLLVQKVKIYAPSLVEAHYRSSEAKMLRYLARRSLRLGLTGKVAWQYMKRSISANWKLTFLEPRRTILTVIASYYMMLPISSWYKPMFR